jgi:DNA-binding transcriptional LysR family regulator
MDVRQLRHVLAVVDHGTFTEAARACHIAQPSLSQSVRSLEAELGIELFHRVGRRVRLTAAGEAFAGPARQTIRDLETTEAAVAEVRGLRAGRLDVACLPTLAVAPTAALIGRFRKAAPEVSVRLHEPDSVSDVRRHVANGASELGLTELQPASDGLQTWELTQQRFVAALPPDAGDARLPRRLSLRALAAWPLVTPPPGTSSRRQLDDAFAAAGLEPRVVIETDHREAIAALVLAGAGAALLPSAAAATAARLGAVVREVTPPIVRSIGLVARPGPMSPAARRFVELATAEPLE